MSASPFPFRSPSSSDLARLVCFPYAGGSAAPYRRWRELFPRIEVCPVEYPGHGVRRAERPHETIGELVAELVEATRTLDDLPLVFFGHSLGGHVAFKVARACEQLSLPSPRQVIVSAAHPDGPRGGGARASQLSDQALTRHIARLGGTPPEIVASPDLVRRMLPTIRADFRVAESVSMETTERIAANLAAFGGQSDGSVPPEALRRWSARTSGSYAELLFAGDHFYLASSLVPLAAAIRNLI